MPGKVIVAAAAGVTHRLRRAVQVLAAAEVPAAAQVVVGVRAEAAVVPPAVQARVLVPEVARVTARARAVATIAVIRRARVTVPALEASIRRARAAAMTRRHTNRARARTPRSRRT